MSALITRGIPQAVPLVGRHVTLQPLAAGHAADLFASASPDLFEHLLQRPHEWSLSGFEALVGRLLSQPRTSWAMVLNSTGRAIGHTSYLNIRPEMRSVEIGTTWISLAHQGTAVNPESKLLLFQYAFETLGRVRVEFLVSMLNLKSRAAVAKLGAVHEGVMRNRWITPAGEVRDVAVFSVTPAEWPAVRAGLEARVDRLLK